jgi:hypothetical protein
MLSIREIDTVELKPWDKNPRINDHAVDAVAKSIETFGFNVPILCDQNYAIIAGHTRWKAAKKLGLDMVPVITLEMNDTQRKAFSVADNKLSSLADWNDDLLCSIFEELRSEEFDLFSIGYTSVEIEALLTPIKDFNWQDFDEYLEKSTNTLFANVSVKVRNDIKETLKAEIKKYASANKLEDKDPAIMTGKVICHLLWVEQ